MKKYLSNLFTELARKAKPAALVATTTLWLLMIGASGCSDSGGIVKAVEDADLKMTAGGLISPSSRADLQATYDGALRRYEANPDDFNKQDSAFIQSHAHFGLAMTRTWGLLQKLVDILDAGAFFESAFNLGSEQGDGGAGANCAILSELGDVELVLKTLLDTAVDPIVESLEVVATYPAFEMTLKSAGFPFPMFGARSVLDMSGTFGQAEVYGLLGMFRLAAGSATWLFAYEGLVSTLSSFLLVDFEPIDNNPAKFFNSNPCVGYQQGNPLLSPTFGVLRPDAAAALSASRVELAAGLHGLSTALKAMVAQGEKQNDRVLSVDCTGPYQPGCAWGESIVRSPGSSDSRFATFDNPTIEKSVGVLESFVLGFTQDIGLEELAAVIDKLRDSVRTDQIVHSKELLVSIIPDLLADASTAVTDWLGSVNIPALDSLDMPSLRLNVLFTAPPANLKSILPIYYTNNEQNETGGTHGRVLSDEVTKNGEDIAASDGVDGKGDYRETYRDANCDGWWNQRGDFVMQREVDAYRDVNGGGTPDSNEITNIGLKIGAPPESLFPGEVGVVGTFLDLNADGVPDRSFDNVLAASGQGSSDCGTGSYSVGWPGSVSDVWDGPIVKVVPTSGLPFGTPVTDASKVFGEHGWVDTGDNQVEFHGLGRWLGHYWPSRDPNNTALKESRRDGANGVYDESYMFFEDPSLGGVLLGRGETGKYSRESWSNGDLNKLISDMGSITDVLE